MTARKSSSRSARTGSNRNAARARAARAAASSQSTGPVQGRRPGTEVWLVAQENAWEADERGLPPRRGSSSG